MATMFAAPKADSQVIIYLPDRFDVYIKCLQLNDLGYKDRKEREKTYMEIQNAQGSKGALSTKMLLKIQGMANISLISCL